MTRQSDHLKDLVTRFGRLASLRDPFTPIWEREGFQLTNTEFHIVMWLGVDGPLPMGDLAARVKTTMPNCTRAIAKLVDAGIVLRKRNPADRRSVLARLSARGERIFCRLDEVTDRQLGVFLDVLEPRDRVALLDILERVACRFEAAELQRAQEKNHGQ
jgi:DNA-binding MarR family transcriptional regulator